MNTMDANIHTKKNDLRPEDAEEVALVEELQRERVVSLEDSQTLHVADTPFLNVSPEEAVLVTSGFDVGGASYETSMTVLDAMEGIVSEGWQGGSGGTGGPLTGELSPGGASQDLTSGELPGGGSYGGPTGGDLNGAGKGPSFAPESLDEMITPPDKSPEAENYGSREETDALLQERALATAQHRLAQPL
jgi:hypothetical protein